MPDMDRILLFLLVGLFFVTPVSAQDTLPRFSVAARGTGKILISWHNNYRVVSQISIQRSTDSSKNFATLITVPDPKLPENGAMDTRAPHPNFYYRLFIVLEGGKYLFTPSRRPGANTGQSAAVAKDDEDDTDSILAKTDHQRILFVDPNSYSYKSQPTIESPSNISSSHGSPEIEAKNTIFIKKGDSLIAQIP